MKPREQWKEVDGSLRAYRTAAEQIRAALDAVDEIPDRIHDRAPVAGITEILEELTRAEAWAAWAKRIAADEAMGSGLLPQRAIAQATGLGTATVKRWAANPLMTSENEEGMPTFGPGTMTRWGKTLKE